MVHTIDLKILHLFYNRSNQFLDRVSVSNFKVVYVSYRHIFILVLDKWTVKTLSLLICYDCLYAIVPDIFKSKFIYDGKCFKFIFYN